MCGLLGTVGAHESPAEFRQHLNIIAHRGPDADGVFQHTHNDTHVSLGHRRLSIIDVRAAANQPMKRGDHVIVFNGEIYNFQALRQELEIVGYKFQTHSDTEVVLQGWRAWGDKVLGKLRGMFAFSIYNMATGELIIARDPFGIKPLFYFHEQTTGLFAFSSELKALHPYLAKSGQGITLNPTALCASLLYVWIPDDYCILNGVQKLKPGTYLTIHPREGVKTEIYWCIQDLPRPETGREAPDILRSIEDSVVAHMVADVPVGTFLSGGLDSSLITAIAAKHTTDLQCFTIGYAAGDRGAEATSNDLKYARLLADKLGITLHETIASPDVGGALERLSYVMDEPIGDAAAINVMQICESAKSLGIKVLLSGMGADEVFFGYRRHQAAMIADRYQQLPKVARTIIEKGVDALPVAIGGRGLKYTRWAKRFVGLAKGSEEANYHRSYTYFDAAALNRLTGHQFDHQITQLFTAHREMYWRGGPAKSEAEHIRRICQTDLQMFLPGLNLTYTDRASMATSTEVRVPFVDMDVVTTAFRTDPLAHFESRRTKAALKHAAEAWLPHEIIYRPKASFGLPLRSWTRNQLRSLINDTLIGGKIEQMGLLDGREIRKIVEENQSGEQDNAQIIWQMLTLELWARRNLPAG